MAGRENISSQQKRLTRDAKYGMIRLHSSHRKKNMSRSIVAEQIEHFTQQGKWMVQGVPGSHAYTIGLTEKTPSTTELITLGAVDPSGLGAMLNGMASHLLETKQAQFTSGERIEDPQFSVPFVVLDVSDETVIRELGAQAFYHYEPARTPRFQQVVWPDAQGRFPWESGSDFQHNGKYHGLQEIIGELSEDLYLALPSACRYQGDH
jgi:hypothetical protein